MTRSGTSMWYGIAVVASACGLLAGCGIVNTSGYTRQRPTTGQLAGTWILQSAGATPSSPSSKGTAFPRIVLKADGTYSMFDVPAHLFSDKAVSSRTSNNSGAWELDNDSCDDNDCWWEIAFRSAKGGDNAANLYGNGPDALEFALDSDATNPVRFVKAQPPDR